MTRHRRGGDSGVLTISLALVFPAVLFLILLVFQVALLWYTDNVALTAAREGADGGRIYGLDEATATKAAHDRAQAFLDQFGGFLVNPTVDPPIRTATTITVTVRVTPQWLPPWLSGRVTESASAPIERYVNP